MDSRIRVFVRLAGKGGRLALWVDPAMLVGPTPRGPLNRFTDIWGHDAEERGPYAGKSTQGDGRLSPLRAAFAKRQREQQHAEYEQRVLVAATEGSGELHLGVSEEAAGKAKEEQLTKVPSFETLATTFSVMQDASQTFTAGSTFRSSAYGEQVSLKEHIESITGIPVQRQKLMFGRVGLLDDHQRAICEYDIGHGALLYLSVRNAPGEKREQKHLAGPGRAMEQDSIFTFDNVQQFMQTNQSKVGPNMGQDLVECLPDWKDSVSKPLPPSVECPQEPYFRRFITVMKGQEQYNTSDSIRGRFKEVHRAARQNAADRHLTPGAAPHSAR